MPRVAFFTDSFHQMNGVGLTSREMVRFARGRNLPFFAVYPGARTRGSADGCVQALELGSSVLALPLEPDLNFDLLFWRHMPTLRKALERFQPDVVHITGPGHCGLLGARLAYRLGVPLVASWHTNVHEFWAWRLQQAFAQVPVWRRSRLSRTVTAGCQRIAWKLCVRFYRLARLLMAPNPELVALLHRETGRPVFLMERGVDTELFRPAPAWPREEPVFTIGYVGRLSAEKNVRRLADLERELQRRHFFRYRLLVVGRGAELSWLQANLGRASFTGPLYGADLAHAYRQMDLFFFPSETDTFGNVVLEALASGVPALVSRRGGPQFLIEDGVTGFIIGDPGGAAERVIQLSAQPDLLLRMREAARQAALRRSWESVVGRVYACYEQLLGGAQPTANI